MKAAVINANSASISDVQAAVNSANPGDTVNVPAGSATWTSELIISSDIQLIGAGSGQTVIYDNEPRTGGYNGTMIYWNTVSNGFCRLSGFSFSYLSTSQMYNGSLGINGYCHAFRLDHCSFTNLYNDNVAFSGWIYGVVDHCVFYTTFNKGEPINDQMPNYGGANYGWGDDSWATPDNWGTTNALYIENNIFVGGSDVGEDAYDGYQGARVVFRYNMLTNIIFGTHGTETGQRERSIRTFEVYNNVFWWATNGNPQTDIPSPWAVYIRGGTGVIYSNQILNGIQFPLQMAAYRSWSGSWYPWGPASGANGWDSNSPTIYAQGTANGPSGSLYCEDTTQNWTPFAWDNLFIWDTNQNLASIISTNSPNTLYYLAVAAEGGAVSYLYFTNGDHYEVRSIDQILDQPGLGQGDLLADTSPGNGIPYDTVTGKTNWPNEVVDPIYQWGNTLQFGQDDASGDYGVAETPTITANYDWIDNSPRPGYTALAYPYPLDTTNATSSLSTFNLTVVNGAGGGSYTNSASVSISANEANTVSNGAFGFWSGSYIANTNSASTTVTMPASNLTVTAIYNPNPPPSIQAIPPP